MTLPQSFIDVAALRMVGEEGKLGGFVIVDDPLAEANPYHDQKGRFTSKGRGGYSPELQASIDQVTDEIRNFDGGEQLVVFNDDGSIAFRTTQMGDPDGPEGPKAAGVEIDAQTALGFEGKVVMHNHPQLGDPRSVVQQHDSFSPDDIMSSVGVKARELRMVNTTSRHTLKPGPDGWGEPRTVDLAARTILTVAERGGVMLNSRQDFTHALSQIMGWTYEVVHDVPAA